MKKSLAQQLGRPVVIDDEAVGQAVALDGPELRIVAPADESPAGEPVPGPVIALGRDEAAGDAAAGQDDDLAP